MTWWAYVQQHSGGDNNVQIASAVNVTPSSVGRWGKGSKPDPAQAAAFARAYGRPVLEAFIAADFLTPEEAGERPSAEPSLDALTDSELLEEVARRMREGGSSADSATKAQKSGEGQVARPRFGAGSKRARMIDDALPVERAADNRGQDAPEEG